MKLLTSLLFFIAILMSTLACMIFNSWIMIWIMLEVNTLSFCSLMKDFTPLKKKSMEMTMKYFIIQSISSSVLLFTILVNKTTMKEMSLLLMQLPMMALLVKMASAPFHQWFISMVKITKWKCNMMLMTWQKMAPIYLILYQMKLFILFFVFSCFIMGTIYQLNKKNTMEILAFSSVFNMGWLLNSIIMNTKTMILFSLLYWISVFLMLFLLTKMNYLSLSNQSNTFVKKWLNFMIIMNLAGVPPLTGFLSKWIVFSEILKVHLFFITTNFLVISALNLYIYTRMFSQTLLFNSTILQKDPKKMKYSFMSISILLMIFPILLLM